MAGAKTRQDVRDLYGPPSLTFRQDGVEMHEYSKVDGAGRYHWLIPIWGWPIAPQFQDTYTFSGTHLYVQFDKDDKIQKWNVVKTKGTMD